MGKLIRFRKQGKAAVTPPGPALFPPFRQPSTDARPAAYTSDASTSDANLHPGVAPDPVIVRKATRKRRSLIAALILLFFAGTAAALFGDRGYLDVKRQEAQLRDVRASNAAAETRTEALHRQVERLKSDPAAVERIAREDLGYVAPGEITLLLPGDDTAGSRGLDSKKPSAIVTPAHSTLTRGGAAR